MLAAQPWNSQVWRENWDQVWPGRNSMSAAGMLCSPALRIPLLSAKKLRPGYIKNDVDCQIRAE